MAKIELGKVIDLIIKEDNASVDALLENWFRQQTKIIHESIMESDDIAEDQDEIEQEEFFGSDDLNESEDDEDDSGEASDLIDPSDEDVVNIKDFTTDPDAIQDQFNDVEDDLDRLKAEFDAIMGNTEEESDDDYDYTEEETLEDDDFGPYDDLAEALKLDTVSLEDIDDVDGMEVGSTRKKVNANDRSPALQKGIDDRMEGAGPVEIRSTREKGYPEFAKIPTKEVDLKGPIRNKNEGLKDVPRDGDPSALLNRKQDGAPTRSVLGDGSNTRDEVIRSLSRRK